MQTKTARELRLRLTVYSHWPVCIVTKDLNSTILMRKWIWKPARITLHWVPLTPSTKMQKKLLFVTDLFNIAVDQVDVKKSARYKWVLFLTELVESRTLCSSSRCRCPQWSVWTNHELTMEPEIEISTKSRIGYSIWRSERSRYPDSRNRIRFLVITTAARGRSVLKSFISVPDLPVDVLQVPAHFWGAPVLRVDRLLSADSAR